MVQHFDAKYIYFLIKFFFLTYFNLTIEKLLRSTFCLVMYDLIISQKP
jgi:hypothetical protein